MTGHIEQINVSNGGVPKRQVQSANVGTPGIEGDRQRDTAHHGGPERALCLFSAERIDLMRAEGHPIEPGSTGENITTRGVDWSTIRPGSRMRLGSDVVIEVTRYTSPCKNIAASFGDGDFNRMNVAKDPANSRVYARVVQEGQIRAGDSIEVLAGTPAT